MKCAHCGAEVNAEDRICRQCNRELISGNEKTTNKHFAWKPIYGKIIIAALIILFFAALSFFIYKTIKNNRHIKISFNNSSAVVQLDGHITFTLPSGWTAVVDSSDKNRISVTNPGNTSGINKFELACFPPALIKVKAPDIRVGDESIMDKVYQNELVCALKAAAVDEIKRLMEFKSESFGFVKLNKKDWAQLELRREQGQKTSIWRLYYTYDGSNIIVVSYEYGIQDDPAKQKLIAADENLIKGVMKQAGNAQ